MVAFMPVVVPPIETWQIEPRLIVRERYERKTDRDFQADIPDGRGDWLNRVRVGAEVKAGQNLEATVEYQFATSTNWLTDKITDTTNSDLFQAFVTIRDPKGKSQLKLGRQRIVLGNGYLVTCPEWGNIGRSYDAVRWQGPAHDAFVIFQFGVSQPRPRHARGTGVEVKTELGRTLALYKHDRVGGRSADLFTLSHRAERPVGPVKAFGELAAQFGRAEGKDKEAWYLNFGASAEPAPAWKLTAELAAASGGSSERTSRTFDVMFGSYHSVFGLTDRTGLRNLVAASLVAEYKPVRAATLRLAFHDLALQNRRDAWYSLAGTPNRHSSGPFLDPTGRSGRQIGREFDVELTYQLDRHSTLMAGYGVLWPGTFVKRTSPGPDRPHTYTYLQLTVKW